MSDTFRGLPLLTLTAMVEQALANGGLILMKRTNCRENMGREPFMALAEQLIKVMNRVPETHDEG